MAELFGFVAKFLALLIAKLFTTFAPAQALMMLLIVAVAVGVFTIVKRSRARQEPNK